MYFVSQKKTKVLHTRTVYLISIINPVFLKWLPQVVYNPCHCLNVSCIHGVAQSKRSSASTEVVGVVETR